jgi:DNA-binding response OmpR family regulator
MDTREDLLTQVWGLSALTGTGTVEVHIAWLRQKLEGNPQFPRYLHTIRGLGSKLSERSNGNGTPIAHR